MIDEGDGASNTDIRENTLPATTLRMWSASGANPVAATRRPDGACRMRRLLLLLLGRKGKLTRVHWVGKIGHDSSYLGGFDYWKLAIAVVSLMAKYR